MNHVIYGRPLCSAYPYWKYKRYVSISCIPLFQYAAFILLLLLLECALLYYFTSTLLEVRMYSTNIESSSSLSQPYVHYWEQTSSHNVGLGTSHKLLNRFAGLRGFSHDIFLCPIARNFYEPGFEPKTSIV